MLTNVVEQYKKIVPNAKPNRRFSTSKLERLERTSSASQLKGKVSTPTLERSLSSPKPERKRPTPALGRSNSSPNSHSLPLRTPSKLRQRLLRSEPSSILRADYGAGKLGYIIPPQQKHVLVKQLVTGARPGRDVKRFLKRRQGEQSTPDNWFQLGRRPYREAAERESIAQGSNTWLHASKATESLPAVYHVDFTSAEIAQIVKIIENKLHVRVNEDAKELRELLWDHDVPSIVTDAIEGRTEDDVRNFCSDLLAGHIRNPSQAQVLSLAKDNQDARIRNRGLSRVPQLLLARELEGNAGLGRMRQYTNFQCEFAKCHEDGLTIIAEFTNCAGDIAAMSWVNGNVICGTTTHSDTHNQQYNKPGNLLLWSTTHGTLRAFADHRIPRPVVSKGDNATEAMRRSQDPWLYSSVVSTDFDRFNSLAFTSSFDKTVKAWQITEDGSSMTALATWLHTGNVNFVAVAKDGSGRVASAADAPTEAVRVYTVDSTDIEGSPYYTISCTRKDAEDSEKWAYFPATMQWGRTPASYHLLAIGYSPRSFSGDDSDIPEDKLRTGEILLWDAAKRCQVPVSSATSTNVFEIMWHPLLAQFIVATSPCGLKTGPNVRTEVHIFRLDLERQDGAYKEFQCLDCPASDINELTIMPNSTRHAYITAACTDGRAYVWDTAQGDLPIHVLVHGHPLDEFVIDREREDTGVKFTAWGSTADRFYTGASDGVVKVWNVRNKCSPFIRNLVHAPGPISCGAFSPDSTKLAIGDATGRVFLLSLDSRDECDFHFVTLPGRPDLRIRRPQAFIRHPEPPPPESCEAEVEMLGAEYARQRYIESGQLIRHPNPVIGVVQGPLYHLTQLFRVEAHAYFDRKLSLLPEYERMQQEVKGYSISPGRPRLPRLKRVLDDGEGQIRQIRQIQHERNVSRDLDLKESVVQELLADGALVLLDGQEGWEFTYLETPDGLE